MGAVILGISLGTTTSGIAVLENGRLTFWHTHSFRDIWSEDKATVISSKYQWYILEYRPRIVIVKIPPVVHHTDAITTLLKKVASLFQYHGCMVEYKTNAEMKAALPEVNNHKELMSYVTKQYPILQPEYRKAVTGKNRYHSKLFDAVLAAHLGSVSVREQILKVDTCYLE